MGAAGGRARFFHRITVNRHCRDAPWHVSTETRKIYYNDVGANNDSPLRTNGHGSSVQTQIDLSHYAAGVYFVKAMADDNVIAVRKVVKQ